MKKKLIVMLLATLMVMNLAACSLFSSGAEDENEPVVEEAVVETVEEVEQPDDSIEIAKETDENAQTETETSENTLAYDPEESRFLGCDNTWLSQVFVPLNAWTNTSYYGLISPYMYNYNNGDYYNDYDNADLTAYVQEINTTEPYNTTNGFDKYTLVGWVPSGQATELTALHVENAVNEDTVEPASTGDIAINLNDVDNNPYDMPVDICFIVEPYGTEPATLSDIFAESDYDDVDQLINDEVNGIVHVEDVRTYTVEYYDFTTSVRYGLVPQSELFDGPGDYAVRVYAKHNDGEWHAINEHVFYVAVRDVVADGIIDVY